MCGECNWTMSVEQLEKSYVRKCETKIAECLREIDNTIHKKELPKDDDKYDKGACNVWL